MWIKYYFLSSVLKLSCPNNASPKFSSSRCYKPSMAYVGFMVKPDLKEQFSTISSVKLFEETRIIFFKLNLSRSQRKPLNEYYSYWFVSPLELYKAKLNLLFSKYAVKHLFASRFIFKGFWIYSLSLCLHREGWLYIIQHKFNIISRMTQNPSIFKKLSPKNLKTFL